MSGNSRGLSSQDLSRILESKRSSYASQSSSPSSTPVLPTPSGSRQHQNGNDSDPESDDGPLVRVPSEGSETSLVTRAQQRREPRKTTYRAKDGSFKRRYRPGVLALKEIRYFQRLTRSSIPRAPFSRLVRAICDQIRRNSNYKFTVGSMLAIQVS